MEALSVTCGCSAVLPKAKKILCVSVFEQKEKVGNLESLSQNLFAYLRSNKFF